MRIQGITYLVVSILLLSTCAEPPQSDTNSQTPPKAPKKVGVFLFAQHPVIDEISRGFKEKLDSELPSRESIEYVERNADGDATQSNAIAKYFAASNIDLVFVVGLPAAQALKAAGIQHPVVFGGPPDPVGAGLVPSLVAHGTNFTGTRYFPPVSTILEVFLQAFPGPDEVAVLHNPGEANSMAVVRAFLHAASEHSLQVRDLGATNAAEIEAALRDLAIKPPGGLFLPTDNLVYSNLDRVIDHAKAHSLPVFNCTKLSVERGALFSLATDYYVVGQLTAGIAHKILFEGTPPSAIDVLDVKEGNLYVSSSHAMASNVKPIDGYSLVSVP